MVTDAAGAAGRLARAASAGTAPDRDDLRTAAAARGPADVLAVAAEAARLPARRAAPDLCGLVSLKTGGCPEDCAYCAQSVRHAAPVVAQPMLGAADILERARRVEDTGAGHVCLVASGRGPSAPDLARVCSAAAVIRRKTRLAVCACLGIIGERAARALRDCGVVRYNHNLETSERQYPGICTTHTWARRHETAEAVTRAGLELCCGGILGLGESLEDRLDLLLALRALSPAVVPVNFLDARPGTPLARQSACAPLEGVLWIALARLVLPAAVIKVAGGREAVLRSLQAVALLAGGDGLIVGGYLTTPGRAVAQDVQLLADAGFGSLATA